MPQSQTVQLPKRWPMVVEPMNRDETTTKDARLVNCYAEKRKLDGQYDLFQRVGLSQYTRPTGGAATGYGVYEWRGNIYSVVGGHLYKDTTDKGAVDTTNGIYRFRESLGATPRLQLGNGVKAYNYDDGAGLVQIADPDFPASFVKGWAYLDGTTYVMLPDAHIQGSDINDTTSWNPLNVLLAQVEPDLGIGLQKQLVYVVAFKQWSTEVFYDAGNATGSPLMTVQGAKVNHGCAAEGSIAELEGVLYWLATSRNAGMYVMKLDGLKPEPISTKPVERLLDNWDLTTVWSWTLRHDGHKFYGLTSKVSNMTLVYDATENLWSQWTDKNGNYWPIISSTYKASTLQHLLQHETNGKIYYADTGYTSDDGDTITVDIISLNFDAGTRRKKQLGMLMLDADQAETELLVRHNDYDYDPKRWTQWRRMPLNQRRPFLENEGTFERRAYHFRHSKPNIRMPRLRNADLQMDLCSL